jgi:hypothetical protein
MIDIDIDYVRGLAQWAAPNCDVSARIVDGGHVELHANAANAQWAADGAFEAMDAALSAGYLYTVWITDSSAVVVYGDFLTPRVEDQEMRRAGISGVCPLCNETIMVPYIVAGTVVDCIACPWRGLIGTVLRRGK